MTDAANLARRFLALWEDYLTALLSDPPEVERLQRWVEACLALVGDPGPHDCAASGQIRQPGPPADTTPAPGASRERDDVVAELACRLARLEERLAEVERRGEAAAISRRRNRRARVR